jgi:hypothetical protein
VSRNAQPLLLDPDDVHVEPRRSPFDWKREGGLVSVEQPGPVWRVIWFWVPSFTPVKGG